MFKKIVCGFLILVGIGFVSAFIRGYSYQSNLASDKPISEEITETQRQNLIDEDIITDILNTEDTISEEDVKNKQINETTAKVVEEKKDAYTNNQSSKDIEVETKIKEEQSKKTEIIQTTPWDELGITEYNYYNNPMWSWDRVDLKVSDYGSRSTTEKACRDIGFEYYEKGYGFSCTNVNSYSGAYLGERLEIF